MANNNLELNPLKDGEIAGMQTMNPIIRWIKGMATTSDFLLLTANNKGSVNLDMDFNLLAGRILEMIQQLKGEFFCSMEGNKLKVAGGHIILPTQSWYVNDFSKNLGSTDDGKGLSIDLTTQGATTSWGSVGGGLNGDTFKLPICTVHKSGKKWWVKHWHLGAYVFCFPPAPFISSWDASVKQSLDHDASGNLFWNSYELCD